MMNQLSARFSKFIPLLRESQPLKSRTFLRWMRPVLLAALLAFLISLTLPVRAANINVGCDVTQLINAINTAASGDSLTLASGCTYTLTSIYASVTGTPIISKTLTINGNNAIIERSTVAGTAAFRLLYVASGGNLTLNDLTLRNGTLTNAPGGGIYNLSGTLTLNHSTVSGNSSSDGGGIGNHGGTLTVTNSTFTSNSSSDGGGGIFSEFNSVVTVSSSAFTSNSAHFNGGGIASNSSTLTVSGSTFTGNSGYEGGAIDNDLGPLTVTTSTFTNNSAPTAGGGGAGIHIIGGTSAVSDSTFTGNTTVNAGGAIHNTGASVLTVSRNTFSNNLAGFAGGGIYNVTGTLKVSGSTFSGNTATNNGGGGIYNVSSGTLNVSNGTFFNNSALLGNGGAIDSVNASPSTVSNSTIYGNAAHFGGGIGNNNGILNLGSSIVANNTGTTAPDLIGTIMSQGYNVIANPSGSTLNGNTGTNLIGVAASPLNLGALADNGGSTQTMALGAGSVAIGHGNCATLSGITPITTDQRGASRKSPCDVGAYESSSNPPTATYTATATRTPTATYTPSQTYTPSRTVTVANTPTRTATRTATATNTRTSTPTNTPTPTATHTPTRTATATTTHTRTNTPTNTPTATYTPSPTVTPATGNVTIACDVSQLIFAINAVSSGSVISLAAGCTYTLTSQYLSSGIGLPLITKILTINGNGATIMRSIAGGTPDFGILGVGPGGVLTLDSVTISHGRSTSGGGGIVNNQGMVTLTNSTLSGNSAQDGGGIYTYSLSGTTVVTIINSTLSGNSANTGFGGGIYNSSSGNGTAEVTVTNSTLSDNGAAQDGGGIYNVGGDTSMAIVNVSNSMLSGNTAQRGGGIVNFSYLGTATFTVTNSTLSNNAAGDEGGGIYNSSYQGTASVTLISSTLSGNSALTHGGGIYNNDEFDNSALHNVVTLNNTILANSTHGGDCHYVVGTFNTSYSLIEDGSCGISNGVNGNRTGDPALGVLTGRPAYFPLQGSSIAIDAGDPAFVPPPDNDQRGAGFPRVVGGVIDIGAFEANLIGPPVVDVSVQLQGRPAAPNTSWVIPLHIIATLQGSVTPAFDGQITTDASGQFELDGLATGNYRLWVKGSHTLAVAQTLIVFAGTNLVNVGILREGDVDDNNLVNLTDFSLLAAAFGKQTSDVGYDARADFNSDDIVNVTDFSLLATNFGLAGDT